MECCVRTKILKPVRLASASMKLKAIMESVVRFFFNLHCLVLVQISKLKNNNVREGVKFYSALSVFIFMEIRVLVFVFFNKLDEFKSRSFLLLPIIIMIKESAIDFKIIVLLLFTPLNLTFGPYISPL